ncbi:MAG TPA: universal stress protein [Marmoricola sp.]|jgi:nucleotide-binding universal stress UspA family protein|nr:universal stress protein [Marmoricola sp.]
MNDELPESLPAETGEDVVSRCHVVVGLDCTEASERALHYAFGLATRLAAQLVVVHVRHTWVTYDGYGPQGVIDDGGLDEQMRHQITRLSAECGVDSTYVDAAGSGRTALVIAQVAEKYRADAVVVGASTTMLHRAAGSIGSQLIKHCGCPVTVVP